jgi:UDP-N-acetyl-D-galactosamine dehydrogenase
MNINHYLEKTTPLAVIGLGYVGLPLALELAKYYQVIGFDISPRKINRLKEGVDPNGELETDAFKNRHISFTENPEDIEPAGLYIVAVPTPIDLHQQPNLKPLLAACETVGKVLKKGDTVCFESTVYPGCTEEDCVPVLEKTSGLSYPQDFKVGYSPERINPGDKVHTVDKIVKVVGGCDQETLEFLSGIYQVITEAGVYQAQSIKVAEAAKIIENTQRDLNISLMNELSMIFKRMDINTYDVLEAAGTKWNFLNFFPGLVGGHCIGVDPYYLTYKATALGHNPRVILSGRSINDNMAYGIAREILQYLVSREFNLKEARILIMGATFKENVRDSRNSKIVDLVKELKSFYLNTEIFDPLVNAEEFREEYGLELVPEIKGCYDVIVLAVQHDKFQQYDEHFFMDNINRNGLFYDVRGSFRHKIRHVEYRSL